MNNIKYGILMPPHENTKYGILLPPQEKISIEYFV